MVKAHYVMLQHYSSLNVGSLTTQFLTQGTNKGIMSDKIFTPLECAGEMMILDHTYIYERDV